MDKVLRYLEEWKEKILFAVVLLIVLALGIPNAMLLVFDDSVVDVDAQVREESIKAANAQTVAETALRLLEKPAEITPTQPDPNEIDKPFFDERDAYVQVKPSAWSLTVAKYESLPPIQLELPGFSALHDFDTPAGQRPALSRVKALVPRDGRKVDLREDKGSEFEE